MPEQYPISLLRELYASEPVYCYARTTDNTEQTAHDDAIITG